ncbi:metallophosphoesterase family protein [Paenibacillus silvae]|uniref:metallophosphoesterase family protein n=1 Tax=Paenibacillus silvae TaxID=1325358 RepID=UPI002004E094|nr:metallophosphoesterase family protein [Paenibacillus silvae]MCK6075066.1 metallophosphatase family protein [Paenibacillus silvae]MCK6149453.1 metallophosphatase family protein [Paenibacillus silvae]MCK6267752.1 metallophosphatase family protein [Paenibacillus silvae]
MKAAILTDIHGNAPALQAVLKDIDQQGDIERLFCLGDMIGLGPYSNEVLDMLYNRKNLTAIAGNHEQAVLHLLEGKGPLEGHKGMQQHHEWIAERLSEDSIKRIQLLPQAIEEEVEGQHVLLTHYHMTDDKLDAIEKEPAGIKWDAKYEGSSYDLICFGHYHILHYFRTARRVYLNPGALGCNDLAVARYGIVDFQKHQLDVKFTAVPYDNRPYLQSYARLNVPGRDFILKAFYGNQLEKEMN